MNTTDAKNIATANDLYSQVKAMSGDMESVDEVKAQLIIEYSKDAIELYGATNQQKKVELRNIIEKAERIPSPDSIDSLKKRAERVVLKLLYPRRRLLRNILLVSIGAMLLLGILPFRVLWNYVSSFAEATSQGHQQQSSLPPKVVLILCDISASLTSAESSKTASLAADVIDYLPTRSTYAVYPIQIDARELPPLISTGIVGASSPEERNHRRKILEQQIHGLSQRRKGASSCILNSLLSARRLLDEMSSPNRAGKQLELVIISDMVEECDETPFGRISLNKEDIYDPITLIRNSDASSYPNLSDIRITILFPLAGDWTLSNPRRTLPYYDLKEFWRLVFSRCGFQKELLDDVQSKYPRWVTNGVLPRTLRGLSD